MEWKDLKKSKICELADSFRLSVWQYRQSFNSTKLQGDSLDGIAAL